MKPKKILFFSFNYLPDQSAGAYRTYELVKNIRKIDDKVKIIILTSLPRRYNQKHHIKYKLVEKYKLNFMKGVTVIRLWIPAYKSNFLSQIIAYTFYFVQSIIISLFIRPNIIVSTSAKLLTGFAAALSSKIIGAKHFLDIRDTFVDNFFYFYRYDKRIFLHPIFLIIENFVIRCSHTLNFVSEGFSDIYFGIENLLKKRSKKITYFSQGINTKRKKDIQSQLYKRSKNKGINIVYSGNIGEGQDLLSLIEDIVSNDKALKLMKENNIILNIYGEGSQSKYIKNLISKTSKINGMEIIKNNIKFKGLIKKDKIYKHYKTADCLLIHLAKYSSLSNVIPTKLFEYASTPIPILHGTSGFTSELIKKVKGTIAFKQSDGLSFLKSAIKSKNIKLSRNSRDKFLIKYDSDTIYNEYAKHILNV